MHFTFEERSSAMSALALDETELLGHTLDIHLKSNYDDWKVSMSFVVCRTKVYF